MKVLKKTTILGAALGLAAPAWLVSNLATAAEGATRVQIATASIRADGCSDASQIFHGRNPSLRAPRPELSSAGPSRRHRAGLRRNERDPS
jgi:hypothetical protein